ncbi:MAG: hypothetical protein HYR76_11220 [Ignavibacteria bacterium]|nr:hypothetical protein [Ignavibacteria bacterium]
MIKSISTRIAILLGSLMLFFGTSPCQRSKSFKNYDEAKEVALSTHKFIFVTFETDAAEDFNRVMSSGPSPTGIYHATIKGAPCSNFIPPEGLDQNFVFLLIPYDAGFALRSKYYSDDKTALVLDGFGNELYVEVCKGRDKLIPILQSLPQDASKYYGLLSSLVDHPDSINLKMAIADLCQLYRATTASNKYYGEILNSRQTEKDSTLSDHVRSHVALNAFLDYDYNNAEDLFANHIKDYPHSSERPMQLFLLTKIEVIKKHKDDAIQYLKLLQTEFPNDQHTTWAKNLLDQYKE